jgi:hypothetical protein
LPAGVRTNASLLAARDQADQGAVSYTNHKDPAVLGTSEKAKWPFLPPQFTELRNDLRDSKSNLLLMVTVAHLAITQKGGRRRTVDEEEEADLRTTIVRLQRARTTEVQSIVSGMSEEDVSRMQKFVRKVRGLKPPKAGKETPKPATRSLEMKSEREAYDSCSRKMRSRIETSKRVISKDRKSSDSGVRQLQPHYSSISEPDTVPGNQVTLGHEDEDGTLTKDKPVGLPAERVTKISEDRPDSQLPVDMPVIAPTTSIESTTIHTKLVASTPPSEMNDMRSVSKPEDETS